MAKRRIQNMVAESVLTLPALGLIALCLWRPWLMWRDGSLWGTAVAVLPLLLVALASYVLLEWGARWQVIRVRTRIITSLFMLGAGIMAPLCGSIPAGVAALAVACVLFFLASCYERQEPVVAVFHAVLCLSLASLLCLQVLWLWPVVLLCLAVFMRAFSVRAFSAAVIGLLAPWFFYLSWWLWSNGWDVAVGTVQDAMQGGLWVGAQTYDAPPTLRWVHYGVTALGGVSLLHFFATRYDDKIRTRMIFYTVQTLWVVVQVLMVCHPRLCPVLLPALWMLTCPMVSHHLALSATWLTTLWMVVVVLALLAGGCLMFNA